VSVDALISSNVRDTVALPPWCKLVCDRTLTTSCSVYAPENKTRIRFRSCPGVSPKRSVRRHRCRNYPGGPINDFVGGGCIQLQPVVLCAVAETATPSLLPEELNDVLSPGARRRSKPVIFPNAQRPASPGGELRLAPGSLLWTPETQRLRPRRWVARTSATGTALRSRP